MELFQHYCLLCFQLAFAGLINTLISGGIVGRMKTKAWVNFIPIWACLVYIPIAHWVWGGGWLMNMGALDFAGGTVALSLTQGFLH